ncbi:hypothetical protein BUALT_Bualt13G0073600 [Buddleja alternifolia]|uniref:Myb/SANT-like domain-containing protein n=1 Tax=Buddleja alternifolia TaxID=168488 RepID=A0AAV6WSP4_9LAMI|nr:hypothetical protein BUALT_Bualt13G0073600 [Buddleja alternifolia]
MPPPLAASWRWLVDHLGRKAVDLERELLDGASSADLGYVTCEMGDEDSENKHDPAYWPDSREKILIELMVKQVRRGNKPSTTFTREGWENIEKELYEKTNIKYSLLQLRTKFYQLRFRYQDFRELLKEPGFTWDPILQKVTASDAVWETHRKANKNMKRFQRTGCPMFNEMRFIYDENCKANFQTANCSLDVETVKVEDGPNDDTTTNCKDYPTVDVGFSQQRSPPPTSHIQEKKKARMTVEGSFEKTEVTHEKRMNESGDMNATLEKNVEGSFQYDGFSITNCVKCLEAIEGVDSISYLKAINLFKDADWREMFMAMSARRRVYWLASL